MAKAIVKVVGLSFRPTKAELKPNYKVLLIKEPDNQFDPMAVKVQDLAGNLLGYIGKNDPYREVVLSANKPVEIKVKIANYHKDGDDKLWKTVTVGDLVQLWLEAEVESKQDDTFIKATSFTGEQVLWSEYHHKCLDLAGNELMGGSTYATLEEKKFDSNRIAKAYAEKNDLDVDDVLDYWNDLGQISMDYGTAIHKAMELYSKHRIKIGRFAGVPRVPHLKDAVMKFLEVSSFDNCLAEPFITDVEMGMSGWVDNLRFLDEKTVVIEDFKTNTFEDQKAYKAKWGKKLKLYKRQLNYYGTILENQGYTVAGCVVWHWHEGIWNKYELRYTKIDEYSRTPMEQK
jgi:hypothetical protein